MVSSLLSMELELSNAHAEQQDAHDEDADAGEGEQFFSGDTDHSVALASLDEVGTPADSAELSGSVGEFGGPMIPPLSLPTGVSVTAGTNVKCRIAPPMRASAISVLGP